MANPSLERRVSLSFHFILAATRLAASGSPTNSALALDAADAVTDAMSFAGSVMTTDDGMEVEEWRSSIPGDGC